ncbi:MAG: DUF1573 domain-containing protein [Bacteroidales bacterium]|nr:DUF1573 domain-containing protein [Bacteroidales bacterium]
MVSAIIIALIVLIHLAFNKGISSNNISVISNDNKQDSVMVLMDTILTSNGPVICFSQGKVDIGKINKTTVFEVDFPFINCGGETLEIQKVEVSCGCLSVSYPKEPIEAGEKGCIVIYVNANKVTGYFNKKVYVVSNASNNVEILYISGTTN